MKHEEHDIQSAFVKAARAISGCERLYATPNAVPVRIRPGEDARLARIKAQQWATKEGRLPGVLDLFNPKSCLCPVIGQTRYHGLYLETKTPDGKLKPDQAEFILYANDAGYGVAVYRSVQEGMDILLRYLRGEHSNEAVLLEARKVLGICSECGGTWEQCKRSRIACCPDCKHRRKVLDK